VLKTRVSLILALVALPATLGLFITPLAVQAGKIRGKHMRIRPMLDVLERVPGIRTNIAWRMLLAGWVPAASAQLSHRLCLIALCYDGHANFGEANATRCAAADGECDMSGTGQTQSGAMTARTMIQKLGR